MAPRHGSSLPSKCLSLKFIVYFCALTLGFGSTDAWTGICFGEDAWNIPSRAEVVQKLRDLGINHVRLYHTYEATLMAFGDSGIQLTVGITNEDFVNVLSSVSSARSWIDTYSIGRGDIVAVTVGNEVFSSATDNVKNALLPSMKNLKEALNQAGYSGIKVTTAHAFDVVTNTFPPSSGQFADIGRMQPLVNWLASVGSDFICNIYPYFTYVNSNGQITLQYGRLESGSVTDSNNGKIYTNLLAQQLDAVYAALGRLGHGNMRVVVGEIGWPTSGGIATDTNNARIHNQNLVNLARGGTPLKPNWEIQAYIFAMFDENQKDAGLEQSWGLYNPTNFQAKYTINFGNSPTLSNRLTPGFRLTTGQIVFSKNKVYWLLMQSDCNLVLLHYPSEPLWESKTAGAALGCYMELQHDGNAVVYGGGVARWASGTWGRNDGAHRIDVQDDGNTVMYNAANKAIWHTNTRGK
ncbi:protein MpGH17.9 [Marchantia polymorpha subsp. ruderalis]